jgi:hypothetical protein
MGLDPNVDICCFQSHAGEMGRWPDTPPLWASHSRRAGRSGSTSCCHVGRSKRARQTSSRWVARTRAPISAPIRASRLDPNADICCFLSHAGEMGRCRAPGLIIPAKRLIGGNHLPCFSGRSSDCPFHEPWSLRDVSDGRGRGVATDVAGNPVANRPAAGITHASMRGAGPDGTGATTGRCALVPGKQRVSAPRRRQLAASTACCERGERFGVA